VTELVVWHGIAHRRGKWSVLSVSSVKDAVVGFVLLCLLLHRYMSENILSKHLDKSQK